MVGQDSFASTDGDIDLDTNVAQTTMEADDASPGASPVSAAGPRDSGGSPTTETQAELAPRKGNDGDGAVSSSSSASDFSDDGTDDDVDSDVDAGGAIPWGEIPMDADMLGMLQRLSSLQRGGVGAR